MLLELYFPAESVIIFDIDLNRKAASVVDVADDCVIANVIVPEHKRNYYGLEDVLQYHMDTDLPMEELLNVIEKGLFYAGCQHNLKARITE